MNKKHILLTGSSGFLGRHLAKKLIDLGHHVHGTNSNSTNLLEENSLQRNFKDIKFDYIFHLAVKTAAGGYCQRHPGEQFLINQTINTNVLNFWFKSNKNAKLITFGSSCGYNDAVKKTESNYMVGLPETGYEVYGMVKRMLLTGLRSLSDEFGMKYVYLIPSTIYGPNYDLSDKHFIFELIRKISDAKYLNVEPVTLWGTGKQRRDIIYVDDCVDITIGSMDKENEIINLATGKDYSIKDYAKEICKITDYDFAKITFDVKQFVGAKSKKIENTKNKEYRFTTVTDGLKKTVDYYKNHRYGN